MHTDPTPQPPSAFLRAWIDAAQASVEPQRASRVSEHYHRGCLEDWRQRFHESPPVVRDLVRLDLRQARVPRLRAALEKLVAGSARVGAPWATSVEAWLDRAPRVLDLHASAFFGCCQPMISLGRPEQAALAATGWSAEDLLDHRLAGHVVHELAHGPARGWTGGPTSWLLLEAAAAVVNLGCQPAHVLAERPGEPVLGLRNALVLGAALLDAVGEDAVWRLSLGATEAHSLLGRRAVHALTAVEWQLWLRSGQTAFVPTHERILSWAKLLDVARAEPALLPALDPLEQDLTPDRVAGLPDLLALADAVPWPDLPAWWSADPGRLGLAVDQHWQVERLQPDLQVCPADPPDGLLVLDVERCSLRSGVRHDDAHAAPTVSRVPPSVCRQLHERGVRRVTLRGCTSERRRELLDRLGALTERPGPAHVEIDLHPTSRRHTTVPVEASDAQLHHADPVITLGSCFATHIGQRLARALFEVHDNPFGILYDPLSVARALRQVSSGASLPEDLLFHAHDRWHSPWHHTDLSHADRTIAGWRMASALQAAQAAAGWRTHWLLTWGTAWVWEDERGVVANCHGLPAERYRKRLLSVEEIVSAWEEVLHQTPGTFILTLSPIRHLRTGLVDNQRSKATLHLAAQRLAERCGRLRYFPAYEIVLDELRDYRWFGPDLVHLTEAAIDEVWDRFAGAFLAPASRALARSVAELQRRLVGMPHDPVRRRAWLTDLLDEVDRLPRSPALPAPEVLRRAVLQQLGATLEVVPAAPASPPEPPPPAPPPEPPPLAQALRPGVFISWEDTPAWTEAVSAWLTTWSPTLDVHQRQEALQVLLVKADELADPQEVLPALTEPLLQVLLPDLPVEAVWALLQAGVPRGLLEVRAETLAVLSVEQCTALAGFLQAAPARSAWLRSLQERLGPSRG